MSPVLVFDLETIPDVAGLRRLRGSSVAADVDAAVSSAGEAGEREAPAPASLPPTDAEVAEAAFAQRRAKTGSDFLPLHLHRIVAIGCLFRDQEGLRIRCLGQPGDPEAKLVQDFYRIIDRYTPQLVSWNGGGFDLQVLHYRSLIHGVQAPKYWDQGEDERDFRYNNYLSRYHARHLDLMDLLALYNGRANAPLDELAKLCGFPGKLGMDGSQVWPAYLDGRLDEIRAYCETDVANTWLMFCRFQRLRGVWNDEQYAREIALARDVISGLDGLHWMEFMKAWDDESR